MGTNASYTRQCSGGGIGGELATFDACQALKFLYLASVTTTTVHCIVSKLYSLGIGMGEARIFVIADGRTMREIANHAKVGLVCVNNNLWVLMQKGLITKQPGRPSTYHLTPVGKRAIAELNSSAK